MVFKSVGSSKADMPAITNKLLSHEYADKKSTAQPTVGKAKREHLVEPEANAKKESIPNTMAEKKTEKMNDANAADTRKQVDKGHAASKDSK